MKNFIIIFSLIGLLFSNAVIAQNDMIIQGMRIIPQSYYSNPAFVPKCNLHIGMPALSSLYLGAGHTGFNSRHLFSIDKNDSLKLNADRLLRILGKNNTLFLELNEEILSFGFKFRDKHYFNFSLTERASAYFSYPKDLMDFVLKGNGAFLDETKHIGNVRISANAYHELALGYSMEFAETWTFGSRAKLLFGIANINTKRSDLSIHTESEMFDITAKTELLANISGIQDFIIKDSTKKAEFDIFSMKNFGLSFDFGATYKFDEKLTFGLSLLDFGFIKWGNKPVNFKSKADGSSFTFRGFSVYDFMNLGDTSVTNGLKDTIVKVFNIDTTYNSYAAMLNAKIHASAFYKLTNKDHLSAILKIDFYNSSVHPSLNVAYMHKFGNIWNVSVAYGISKRNFANIGIGSSLQLGFLQFYLLTDNVLGFALWNRYNWTNKDDSYAQQTNSVSVPRNWKNLNVHFGVNFLFGCEPKKVKAPIIY